MKFIEADRRYSNEYAVLSRSFEGNGRIKRLTYFSLLELDCLRTCKLLYDAAAARSLLNAPISYLADLSLLRLDDF